jgi:membrane-bound serine protease (ClpP class)
LTAAVLILAAIVLFLVLPEPWDAIAFVVLLVFGAFEIYYWWRTVRGRRVQTGAEALIGARGRVTAACRPDGEVWVEGARWKAHCDAGADIDDAVTVVGRDGLMLIVEPR